jgi:hypothetical protein
MTYNQLSKGRQIVMRGTLGRLARTVEEINKLGCNVNELNPDITTDIAETLIYLDILHYLLLVYLPPCFYPKPEQSEASKNIFRWVKANRTEVKQYKIPW